MVELRCPRVVFRSSGDEAAFFSWVGSIAGIQRVVGVGDEIRLDVPQFPSDDTLHELLAVCRRYDIDMSQLAHFATESNSAWFARAYWHSLGQADSAEQGVAPDRRPPQ